MRIYISPGVWVNTTQNATLNAYIDLPSDGSYNSVIVAYDNCGHAFSMPDPIYVQGTSGGAGSIGVSAPVSGTVLTSPIHFAAFAQVENCAKGIAAMRIYTTPGVNAFTTNSASFDTHLSLAAGTYNTVIQAWDNCGHVYKAPVTITVR
jgi:phospholipase C